LDFNHDARIISIYVSNSNAIINCHSRPPASLCEALRAGENGNPGLYGLFLFDAGFPLPAFAKPATAGEGRSRE
jgi:hypothetical protein